MFKAQRGEKGFTLIELLIVIAIIGILAAIAIPAYTGYTRKAKVQEVIGAMGSVKTAVMAYYTESQPAAATGWTEDVATSADVIRTKLGVDVPTKYLTSISVNQAGVITATLNNVIGGDATGTVILTPNIANGLKTWTWSGSLPDQYKPKN